MPPEQSAQMLALADRLIAHAVSSASRTAPPYVSSPQPRCLRSGLRQEITNTWWPWPTRYSTMLRPGARSVM